MRSLLLHHLLKDSDLQTRTVHKSFRDMYVICQKE
ncbi:unnamed protein product [Musa textilis]